MTRVFQLGILVWVVALLAGEGRSAPLLVLSPGYNLHHASNPSAIEFLDWDGDGGSDLIAYDPIAKRVTRAQFFLTSNPSLSTPLTVMDLPSGKPVVIATAELDGDPGDELIVLEGDQAFIWDSSARRNAPLAGPSRVVTLPAFIPSSHDDSGVIEFGDFDGDQAIDLLLTLPATDAFGNSTDEGPGSLIFSFGKPQSEIRELTSYCDLPISSVRSGPRWREGGPPTLLIEIDSASYPAVTSIVELGRDRQAAEIHRGVTGLIAELDGTAPPEQIFHNFLPSGLIDSSNLSSFLQIDRWIDGAWQPLEVVHLHDGSPLVTPKLIPLDLDSDGAHEIFIFNIHGEDNGRDAILIDHNKSTGRFSRSAYPLGESPPFAIQARRIPHRSETLLIETRLTVDAYTPLGSSLPVSESRYQTTFRFDPLNLSDPKEKILHLNLVPTAVKLGDMNKDGKTEVVMLGSGFHLNYLKGPLNQDSAFSEVAYFGSSASGDGDLWLADLDGDGDDDIVRVMEAQIDWRRAYVRYDGSLGVDNGGEIRNSTLNGTTPTRILGDADFDFDGDIDLFVLDGTDQTLAWLENPRGSGSTNWRKHVVSLAGRIPVAPWNGTNGVTLWPNHSDTHILDFDGDGDLDIITYPSALGNRVALHRNTPVGYSLEPLSPSFEGYSTSIFRESHAGAIRLLKGNFREGGPEYARLTGISMDDLGNTLGPVIWLLGADFSQTSGPTIALRGPPMGSIVVVDFDQDGFDDLIGGGSFGPDALGNLVGTTAITWFRSQGDGTFAPGVTLAKPLGTISDLLTADFNGDGRPDLLSVSSHTGTVEVFFREDLNPIPIFDDWIAQFDLDDPTANGDPDHDGIPNIMEYSFGTSPAEATVQKNAPRQSFFTSYYYLPFPLTATFFRPRRMDDEEKIQVDVEWSSNLTDWFRIETEPSHQVDPSDPLWERISWDLPSPEIYYAPNFHRFKVTNPSKP